MPLPTFPSEDEARHEEGFIYSADHLRLFWQRYTPLEARATVAVLHGGGDHSGRYPAITTALVGAGFQVALVDFRGHGQSDGRRWHIDSFGDYLADLDAFVAKLSQDGVARERLFLLGHSQGGLIAALWGLSRRRVASGFVLSSPYLSLAHRVPFAKVLGAKLIGKVVPWFPLSTGLRGEDLTADPELAAWTNGDPLYCRSTTPRWVAESGKAQREVLRRKGEWRAPLLVLAAGADGVAETSVTRAFVDGCGGDDKEMRVYASFRHEIFNEVERDRPIGDAVAWLVQRSG